MARRLIRTRRRRHETLYNLPKRIASRRSLFKIKRTRSIRRSARKRIPHRGFTRPFRLPVCARKGIGGHVDVNVRGTDGTV